MATFETAYRSRLIYVFAINDEWHKGCLKVGETTLDDDTVNVPLPNSEILNKAARARIDQYTKTAGIAYTLLYTEMTMFIKDKQISSFNDKQVHDVLTRSGIKKKVFDAVKGANEWFCCDLDTVKNAIAAVKSGRNSLNPAEINANNYQEPICFRPEQLAAIEKTKKRFTKGNQMLWNAKMRFGKTLSALQVAKDMGMKRTIILTHRPVVDEGWFEDFGKIFFDRADYHYGSRTKGEKFTTLESLASKGDSYVYFASMQDMRGAELVGGKFDKNNEVFSTEWDFLIVDEAHEGTQTELGQAVLKELTKADTKVLKLSGTPFNLLDDYTDDETYTWDYTMEQRAKTEWDLLHMGDPNPYASLPAINIYTYDLGKLMSEYIEDEKAFNFREFFRTKDDGCFIHESDVDNFLNLLCKDDRESLYPYSNEKYRSIFRHTLWVVPGVKSARALSAKLQAHPVFGNFDIVNVAGDGDADEESKDALKMVNDAIGKDPDETYTITLSCGRLTTGVSIKPWTAVFMMAGSFSTSAAGYMQTIFRVQTPFVHNGKMKEQCYAFDFAPDRTLRILAEVAKVSAKVGKATEEDRRVLGDFLNFCPIISIEGSQMKNYDVNSMMGQLKKAQIEKVVQQGFEDGALYNDELLKLTEVDLLEFKNLKGTIGKTAAMPKTGDIDVNNQGFTNEEYAEQERIKKKPKHERTPEEQARLDELKNRYNQRKEAISILRGISIRMPLLIYGAELTNEEEEITIDNFANLVDDTSWEEFMPKGVTKEVFSKFKKFYEADVFREAGKRIRAMARAADKFSIEERIERIAAIFNTFRNPDKETVLTPWRVVNMHLSESLGGWCFMDDDFVKPLDTPRYVDRGNVTKEVFSPESIVMEINSKSGLYPLLAAYNIFRRRMAIAKDKYGEIGNAFAMQLWDLTIEQNILVVCKTPMARSITRRTLVGFRDTNVHAEYYRNLIENITKNPDLVVNTLRDGKNFWKLNDKEFMTIDAIIGNPPYQQINKGDGNGADPLYHLFIDLAMRLGDKSTLIHPARFLFNAGKTPKEWNNNMLNNTKFRVAKYWANSTDVFPTVDIKGGVAITYHDRKANFGSIGFFSAYEELRTILSKVKAKGGQPFSSIVGPRELYRITDDLYNENPEMDGRQSTGHKYSLGANIFEIFPELFSDSGTGNGDEMAKVYGRSGNRRCFKWIKRKYITHPENFEKFKVIIPEANGSGAIGEVLSTPIVGLPIVGYTDTFIGIGAFDTESGANSCLKYVKSKFARTLLGTLKATQHNPRETWANVPMQDFTQDSDINWNVPIPEIDNQLYEKYHLTEAEIQFIEKNIKPMQ